MVKLYEGQAWKVNEDVPTFGGKVFEILSYNAADARIRYGEAGGQYVYDIGWIETHCEPVPAVVYVPDGIKVGSKVRLKSGGPKMTVRALDEPSDVVCTWFSEWGYYQDLKRGSFPLECVELVREIDNGDSESNRQRGSTGP